MLSRALKMSFWVAYDHLGKLLVASLVWAFAVTGPAVVAAAAWVSKDPVLQLLVGVPAALGCLGIALPVCTAGLAHMVQELINTRDGSVRTMFAGMSRYGRRATGIGFIYLLVFACLTTSTWFYAAKLGPRVPWLGYSLSALALWCLILAALTSLLVMPALVQKKDKTLAVLKLTVLLVLDNPLLTVGLGIQVLAVTAVALAAPPLFFFLYGGGIAVLTGSAYEMLARKYAAIERARAASATSASRLNGLTRQKTVPSDEDDDYLNRGFRDFLFPWKG